MAKSHSNKASASSKRAQPSKSAVPSKKSVSKEAIDNVKEIKKALKGKAQQDVEEDDEEDDEEDSNDEEEGDWEDDDMEEMSDDDDDDDEEDSEDDDEDNGGVSSSSMKRLMELLGEDGLDEIALAQLADGEDEDDGEVDGEDDQDDAEEEDEEENVAESSKAKASTSVLAQDNSADPSNGLALDDIDSDLSVDEDAVPQRKITINKPAALKVLREQVMVSNLPFDQHLTVISRESNFDEVDPMDDLNREVAFYQQALAAVPLARKLCAKHDIPFSRPRDYYAEMVKTDAHMERVRSKLVEEASSIKKSEAAKRQRELKKYGKQIQQEKLKSRAEDRKAFDERLRGVKRKREGGANLGGDDDADDFGISLDRDFEGRAGRGSKKGGDKSKMPRHARDAKYGMGGKGRRSKQNTRESTNDFGGAGFRTGSAGGAGGKGGNKGKSQRPGKSRRQKGGKF